MSQKGGLFTCTLLLENFHCFWMTLQSKNTDHACQFQFQKRKKNQSHKGQDQHGWTFCCANNLWMALNTTLKPQNTENWMFQYLVWAPCQSRAPVSPGTSCQRRRQPAGSETETGGNDSQRNLIISSETSQALTVSYRSHHRAGREVERGETKSVCQNLHSWVTSSINTISSLGFFNKVMQEQHQ